MIIKYIKVIILAILLFCLLGGIYIIGSQYIWPYFQDARMNHAIKVAEENARSYIPDSNRIAQYLEEFNKRDLELSETGEYIVDAIKNPIASESPYGSFVSNQLMIRLKEGVDCNKVKKVLTIVHASSSYNISVSYGNSGEILSEEKYYPGLGGDEPNICGMSSLIILPPDSTIEQFIAIEEFLKRKKELFEYIYRNNISVPN